MENDGSDTKTDLIEGAIRVIASRGLRGLTLRAAAAEAGVTHGMVRHHFGTRERLIEASMKFAVDRSLAGAQAQGGQRPPLGAHTVEVGQDPDGVMAFQREVLNEALRNPRLQPLAANMYSQYEEAVRSQLLALNVSDPDAAILVGAAMDGLVRRQMDIGDVAATERSVALLIDIVQRLASGVSSST